VPCTPPRSAQSSRVQAQRSGRAWRVSRRRIPSRVPGLARFRLRQCPGLAAQSANLRHVSFSVVSSDSACRQGNMATLSHERFFSSRSQAPHCADARRFGLPERGRATTWVGMHPIYIRRGPPIADRGMPPAKLLAMESKSGSATSSLLSSETFCRVAREAVSGRRRRSAGCRGVAELARKARS